MSRQRHLELSGQGPLYRQLILALREQGARGDLKPGDLLPSTRELASRLQIHRHTVAAAFQELEAEGWIGSEPGRGFRVAHSPVVAAEIAPPPDERHPVPVQARFRFPSGQPDLRLFPREEYFGMVRKVMRDMDPEELLGYSSPLGRDSLRHGLTQFLTHTRGLRLTPENLVVTHGCQEAVFLLGQLLLSRGDRVGVEEKGFPPMWKALRQAGAELIPLSLDRYGLLPEAVEEACRRRPLRMLYLTPVHQYPTTATLPLERRQAIYELAVRCDFYVLEDDYDSEFHFTSQPPAPMKAYDPHDRILYCGTLSKLLAPSLRLGFAVVPTGLAERLGEMKSIVSRQNDTLSQEAVAAWMAEGGFERHLRRMRRRYGARRQVMLQELDRWRERGLPWSYLPSGGGMSLWVDFGQDSQALSEAALGHDVEFRGGRYYEFGDGSGDSARLGFCYPDEDDIVTGLARLANAQQPVPPDSEGTP